MLPAGSIDRALYRKLLTQSSASEDGRNYRPKQVELIEIINKPLLLHLVGYLYYWQMGFNSVFKGLSRYLIHTKEWNALFKTIFRSKSFSFYFHTHDTSNSPHSCSSCYEIRMHMFEETLEFEVRTSTGVDKCCRCYRYLLWHLFSLISFYYLIHFYVSHDGIKL